MGTKAPQARLAQSDPRCRELALLLERERQVTVAGRALRSFLDDLEQAQSLDDLVS